MSDYPVSRPGVDVVGVNGVAWHRTSSPFGRVWVRITFREGPVRRKTGCSRMENQNSAAWVIEPYLVGDPGISKIFSLDEPASLDAWIILDQIRGDLRVR